MDMRKCIFIAAIKNYEPVKSTKRNGELQKALGCIKKAVSL